jgi:hypothetical protein
MRMGASTSAKTYKAPWTTTLNDKIIQVAIVKMLNATDEQDSGESLILFMILSRATVVVERPRDAGLLDATTVEPALATRSGTPVSIPEYIRKTSISEFNKAFCANTSVSIHRLPQRWQAYCC